MIRSAFRSTPAANGPRACRRPGPGPALVLAAALVAGGAGVAQQAPQFRDFTARRIAVPTSGDDGPRISVQIEPGDNFMTPDPTAAAGPDPASSEARVPASDEAAWFWTAVPAARNAPGNRFAAALEHLAQAPEAADLPVPSPGDLRAIVAAHGREILAATIGTEVSPALVLAVIAVESAGRADAISSAGAQGLMQLIPDTAARFEVADPLDPGQNIRGGAAYLDWLTVHFGRDTVLALAGYNAGEGAVAAHGGVPPYAETRAYVPRVLATWSLARALCLTPPELPSDGCVFAGMAEG